MCPNEMPDWAQEHFAEPPSSWKPHVHRIALHCQVLVVATTRIEGMWCAYCAAVPGIDHSIEYHYVLEHGDKLPERYARAIFPFMKGIPYAQ